MFSVSKLIWKREKKIGLPPGTPVFVGEQKAAKTRIRIMDYNETSVSEDEIEDMAQGLPVRDSSAVTWINVDGIHDAAIIVKIGTVFGIHALTVEDILNTQHRPKIDDYGDYIFIVIKMITFNEADEETRIEQVSLILRENLVVSFQEREGDIFDPIRERIRTGKGRVRKMGADYLAYLLVDSVIDYYYTVIEKNGEIIEELEERVVMDPEREILNEIHHLKKEMLILRRSLWPHREVVRSLSRSDSSLVRGSTRVYFNDVYDHAIHIIETVEIFREMLSGMHDTYLTSVSNRMNEVMKVLTIIATIFIPLTFIAGIYGMNFKYMPELSWRWSYFVLWGVNIVLVLVMMVYFKKRKWL